MEDRREVDVSPLLGEGRFGKEMARRELVDAVDAASDQDKITWLVDQDGRKIAAVVPVDVAEAHERQIAGVLQTGLSTASRCPEVPHERHTLIGGGECLGWPEDYRPVNRWVEAPRCTLFGHAQHELNGIIYRPGSDGLTTGPDAHPVHAHWVGDREAGHEEFMKLMAPLTEKFEAAARAGLPSRKRRH